MENKGGGGAVGTGSIIGKDPDIFWGVVASMHLGNVRLFSLNLPLIGPRVQLLRIP